MLSVAVGRVKQKCFQMAFEHVGRARWGFVRPDKIRLYIFIRHICYYINELTRRWALESRMHNSHRPCGAVSLSDVTSQRDGAARLSRRDFFCTFWPCNPDLWPFDLIFTGGRGVVIDYHVPVLVSAVLVLLCGQTHRQTYRITEVDDRYTHATTGGVSKDSNNKPNRQYSGT